MGHSNKFEADEKKKKRHINAAPYRYGFRNIHTLYGSFRLTLNMRYCSDTKSMLYSFHMDKSYSHSILYKSMYGCFVALWCFCAHWIVPFLHGISRVPKIRFVSRNFEFVYTSNKKFRNGSVFGSECRIDRIFYPSSKTIWKTFLQMLVCIIHIIWSIKWKNEALVFKLFCRSVFKLLNQ